MKNIKMERERVLTLNDLWGLFLSKLLIMIIVAAIIVGMVFIYNSVTFEPKYKSTATLYILRQNERADYNEVKDDFSLALNVVNDCTYLLKSHAVLDDVIEELSLDVDYETLSASISTNNPENTRILEVIVTSDSPDQSKIIVDCVCDIGSQKIKEAMGFNQVNLYEKGTLETEPYNKMGLLAYVIIAIISIALVYVVFLIAFLLDDRIRTDEDIENYLGLSILGDIPNAYDNSKKKYGYYKGTFSEQGLNRHDAEREV